MSEQNAHRAFGERPSMFSLRERSIRCATTLTAKARNTSGKSKLYPMTTLVSRCRPAVSADGVSWTRLSREPLLPNGNADEWNAGESGHPGVFTDRDGQMYLFFQGNNDKGASWHLSMMKIAWDERSKPCLIRPGDGRTLKLQ